MVLEEGHKEKGAIVVTKAATEVRLTVYFCNGQKLSYRAEVRQDQVENAGSRIENVLKGNYFGPQVGGKLVIIPLSGIQRVEIDPAPDAMISHVMPCIQQLDDAGLGG